MSMMRKKIILSEQGKRFSDIPADQKETIKPPVRRVEKEADGPLGLHLIKPPKGANKRKKILGRGSSSGHGKTSTRGSKGQTSRAGRHFYLGFEGGQTPLIRRIPKRGFTSRFKKEYQIVNLRDFDRVKETTITLALMRERGLIKDTSKLVKVLGAGVLKNALVVEAHAFSQKAAAEIKNAGGKAEIIEKS